MQTTISRLHKIQLSDGPVWATFLVEETDDGFDISISSSFGDFSGSISGKKYEDIHRSFGFEEEFDKKAFFDNIRKQICDSRRDYDLSAEFARKLYNETFEAETMPMDSTYAFDIGDDVSLSYAFRTSFRPNRNFQSFINIFWPSFMEALEIIKRPYTISYTDNLLNDQQ